MVVIGLTGQSGAGKSTVCRMLEQRGCAVLDCDRIARSVTEKGSVCLKELCRAFGADILEENGELNRRKLAGRAFSSRAMTDRLNAITHPYIREKIEDELCRLRRAGTTAVILDAPQLFEAGCERYCDRICVVTAPWEVRLQRLQERDRLPRDLLEKRMRAQLSEEELRKRAHQWIDGSLPLPEVEKQVEQCWQSFCLQKTDSL